MAKYRMIYQNGRRKIQKENKKLKHSSVISERGIAKEMGVRVRQNVNDRKSKREIERLLIVKILVECNRA